MTAADFAPHIGTTFTIAGEVEATLENVQEREADPSAPRQPFNLLFRGPREPLLPQQTYRVEHDRLGTLEIFLVPVGSSDAGTLYEAVFN
jgi:hypothetical protein